MPEPPRRITRDMVLFVGGFFGIFHETVVREVDRPALLAVFAGMCGLPLYLRRDEQQSGKDDPDA